MDNRPSIFLRVLRGIRRYSPKFYYFSVVATKIMYVKMFLYVMPSSSLEGLVILYGLLFIVGMLRLPEKYRQTEITEIIIWVLAVGFVLGVDWLIIYLSRPDISILAV